ncbi:DUF4097 family beta strand repeat-containing protein [Mucilaginibacter auburnensis]|uniref:Adhesin n=1 Tax=Mucilaginibacter auburnensis TaxID=1457233 RepID=A0A2H9VTQ8_9SPHI|nr:DUF4097 family beta strand repeat-containing protein [Mucilaginibacter auburnensis]PJJ84198.1 hypothetical protein CLV57_1208 [Mucilaginibacter auburnensis]
MKTLKTLILLFTCIAVYRPAMAQTEQKAQLTIALSDPGKPYRINVSLLKGSINVAGYDGKDIIVEILPDASKSKAQTSEAGGMRVIGGSSNSVVANEKSNRVNISGSVNGKSSDLKIRIPRNASSIKLATVNGGSITANDVGGDIEVNNVNGGIKLTNVSGSVVANTTNGNLMVAFKSADPNAAMAFSTFNGVVDVTLPATLKANVKLHTDHGDVLSDFDVAVAPSTPSVTKSKDGTFRYSDQEWLTGKIGGGGPELMMKTYNGNIYIRKAK